MQATQIDSTTIMTAIITLFRVLSIEEILSENVLKLLNKYSMNIIRTNLISKITRKKFILKESLLIVIIHHLSVFSSVNNNTKHIICVF